MKTFTEYYQDKQIDRMIDEAFAANNNIISESPFIAPVQNAGIKIAAQKAPEVPAAAGAAIATAMEGLKATVTEYIQSTLFTAGMLIGVPVAVRLLGTILKKIVKKSKQVIKDQEDDQEDTKEIIMAREIMRREKEGEKLSAAEIHQIKRDVVKELAERFPKKKLAWWEKVIDKLGDFFGSKAATMLSVLGVLVLGF